MKIDTKQLKIGDQVYIFDGYSFNLARVLKVTPAGLVDTAYNIDDTASPRRWRADGNPQSSPYSRAYLDLTPFDERTALIAKEKRAREATAAIAAVIPTPNVAAYGHNWGKECLLNEIGRLQSLLDVAREKVEVI